MPRSVEVLNYKPPVSREEKRLRKKLSITAESVNHGKPTLMKRENRDELR